MLGAREYITKGGAEGGKGAVIRDDARTRVAFARANVRAFAAQRLAAGLCPRLGGRKAGRLQAGRRVGL